MQCVPLGPGKPPRILAAIMSLSSLFAMEGKDSSPALLFILGASCLVNHCALPWPNGLRRTPNSEIRLLDPAHYPDIHLL